VSALRQAGRQSRLPLKKSAVTPFNVVVAAVAGRRTLQKEMLREGVVNFDMASPIADDHRKLRRLTQSLGYVADQLEAIEEKDCLDSRVGLRDALLQLTCNGFAWLEQVEARDEVIKGGPR
jgi:hypothetical protein